MDANELKDFSRRAEDQLFGHILPFWCGPALDREQGGWMGWLSNDLKPDRSQPKASSSMRASCGRFPPSIKGDRKCFFNKWPIARLIS